MRPDAAITLHGLAMHGWTTAIWRRKLAHAGFETESFAYRSISNGIDANANLLAKAIKTREPSQKVHLAGHSLGGLVILRCLSLHRFENLGRVVLVGSPIQGSAAAEKMKKSKFGAAAIGKSLPQWNPLWIDQIPGDIEIATIAGSRGAGLGSLVAKLPKPHDGTVGSSEARYPGAASLILPHSHTSLLASPAACEAMVRFFKVGRLAASTEFDSPC